MRLAIAACFVMLAACSRPESPAAAAPAGPPAPAPETLHAVVGDLNTLCADTWCVGGWDFTFKKLECASGIACTLTFDAKPDGESAASTATIPLVGFDAVVGTSGDPTVAFETAVNDAIAEWETQRGAAQ